MTYKTTLFSYLLLPVFLTFFLSALLDKEPQEFYIDIEILDLEAPLNIDYEYNYEDIYLKLNSLNYLIESNDKRLHKNKDDLMKIYSDSLLKGYSDALLHSNRTNTMIGNITFEDVTISEENKI